MPGEATGKRVRVKLRNGRIPAESWPADGKGACNWALTREGLRSRAFDIIEYEVI